MHFLSFYVIFLSVHFLSFEPLKAKWDKQQLQKTRFTFLARSHVIPLQFSLGSSTHFQKKKRKNHPVKPLKEWRAFAHAEIWRLLRSCMFIFRFLISSSYIWSHFLFYLARVERKMLSGEDFLSSPSSIICRPNSLMPVLALYKLWTKTEISQIGWSITAILIWRRVGTGIQNEAASQNEAVVSWQLEESHLKWLASHKGGEWAGLA